MTLSNVLLPQPEGPTTACRWPREKEAVISRSSQRSSRAPGGARLTLRSSSMALGLCVVYVTVAKHDDAIPRMAAVDGNTAGHIVDRRHRRAHRRSHLFKERTF